ncbi:MAG: UDP-2-acetamido-2,6-beta-L-arabino-hexul-4-ose reductase [Actinomycetota bacterium]|nr:UDP-2-acetamido-2,6-beta-L-arabino-hexul-4-ose reductase [Actinomycetota bacterium]
MTVLVTGGNGFLGRHVRVAAAIGHQQTRSLGHEDLSDPDVLRAHLDGALGVIHCAGVNRGDDDHVYSGNVRAARSLADALTECHTPPTVVYANSVAAANGTPYGRGKAQAGDILAKAAANAGSQFVDVGLPNLFGEGCRPDYNSFVATFAARIAEGRPVSVTDDREILLVHAQDAAQQLLTALRSGKAPDGWPHGHRALISHLAAEFDRLNRLYTAGHSPQGETSLAVQLFNILRRQHSRTATFLQPVARSDPRGTLWEGVRHDGQGQVFFSSTLPGKSRGGHFHRRKYERFMVLSGTGRLDCHDLVTGERSSALLGDAGLSVADMRTFEIHTLTNVGQEDLLAAFWISEHFDPDDTDTYVLEAGADL